MKTGRTSTLLNKVQSGFALLPVAIALVVVASIVLLINYQGATSVNRVASDAEANQAHYIAQAGMQHALWQARNSKCTGDVTIPTTALDANNYIVTSTGGGTSTAYTLSVDQDAWIRSDDTDKNNGSTTDLHIRFESGNVEQPLVRFDLSSLPANAQINSAAVWFYIESGKEHPEGPVSIHKIIEDWTEAGVTWDSFNASYDNSVIGMIPAQADSDVWVQVNLTAQVQAWVNGEPNYGVLLNSVAEGVHAEYVSSEGASAQHPRLEVVVGTSALTPLTLDVTGTLANGVVRTLNRNNVREHQPRNAVMLQPGPAESDDAEIWDQAPNTNYGDEAETWVSSATNDTTRSLLRFNMSAIPTGAKILEATLSLERQSGSGANEPVSAHRIMNPWSEASVTWNDRETGTNWGTAGGDFENMAVATTPVGPGNHRYEWAITALAQGWVDGSYPNYGVALTAAIAGMPGHRFYTSDHVDPRDRPSLTITYACECGSACMAPQGSGNILMVVRNDTNMWFYDTQKRAILESWGYTVNIIDDAASAAEFDAGIAANDVAYISEPVTASDINSKLTNAAIGVISDEGRMNVELGIAADFATPVLGNAVNVTDTTHYITQVFRAGSLEIYSADMEGLTVAGTEAPGLQTLADWGGAGSLVVLDAGMPMQSGGNAAGRRVMLPFGRQVNSNVNWDRINNNGRLIVQRALEWGMNANAVSSGKLLLVVGNAGSPSSKDQDRKTLMESWGYAVTLIDDGDSQANFNTSMAANDVVYVTDGVSGPTLVDKVTNTSTPVVNEKGSKLGNFGFSSVESGTVNAANFAGTDAAHYITEPFSGSPVTVFTLSLSMPVPSGTLAPDLQTVGDVGGTPALVTLDTGATLWNGGSAPARRAHLPLGSAEITQLTADGQTILQRAIEWAATTPPPPADNVLLIVGNDTTLSSKDVGYKALMESWGYTVTVLDDGASQANYDTAMAAADVIYASGSALGANIQDKATETTKGVVNEVPGKLDNFGFSSSKSATANFDTFSATNATHYITEPFGGSAVTVFTSSLTNPVPSGTLAPDLQNVGEVTGTLALGTLDAGATRYEGDPSQGRRAHLPFTSAETTDMTADGQTILQRAIEWAAGAGGGGGLSGTYLDEFNAIAYNGDDGTLSWSNDWQETGESDGPGSGDFSVVNNSWCASGNCIQIREDRSSTRRLSREVDLTGAVLATLSLNYRRRHVSSPIGGTITLEISDNGGASFTPLKVYQMDTQDSTQQSDSFDISSYIASNTQIRFSTSNVLYETVLYVDNVLIDTTGGGGGGGGGSTFRDEFNINDSYAGSDGTLTWSTNWLEIGESDGATTGDEQVRGYASQNFVLRIRDNNNGGEGVQREADLSVCSAATLSFDYLRNSLDSTSDYITLDISSNGGTNWTELDRFEGPATDSAFQPTSYDISTYMAANTRIRLLTSSSLGNTDEIYVDNVDIACP